MIIFLRGEQCGSISESYNCVYSLQQQFCNKLFVLVMYIMVTIVNNVLYT